MSRTRAAWVATRRTLGSPAVRTIAAAYLASRAIILLAAWFAENIGAVRPVVGGEGGPLLTSLTKWDGLYYLSIARHGYHVNPIFDIYHDYAFFPLYPLAVRLLSFLAPGGEALIAVLLSNVAFLAALWLFYRLGRPHLGERDAARSAAILAIFPYATVFSMAYTESLFLLFTVAAFMAAERRQRPAMGVCLALAALTRAPGVLLTLPLLILLLRQDGWRPRASLAWLAAGPLAFFAYMGFVWRLTGDLTAYATAQAAWGHPGPSPGAPDLGAIAVIPAPAILLIVAMAAYMFLFVYVRPDRLAPEYVSLPAIHLLAIIPLGLFLSAPRFLMVAFPFAWILARRRNSLFRQGWPIVSSAMLGMFSLLIFGGWLIP